MTIRYRHQSAQLAEVRRTDLAGQGRWSFTGRQQTLRRRARQKLAKLQDREAGGVRQRSSHR